MNSQYVGVGLMAVLFGAVVVANVLPSGSDAPAQAPLAAAPSCAGVVLARPLTPQEAVQAVVQSAHDLGTPGPDSEYGAGRLDICAAFAAAATITAPPHSVGGVAEAIDPETLR